jgi:hypothetical protein
MDKLEQYLDRVCRGIGGPRALRQHVRQELREHLLDAAAEHKKAGLTEERAIEKALADFGAPDEVRSELEATHGQRVMAVVIDKALDWKEKTMRAKWLWATWAHVALAVAVVVEVLLLTFVNIFITPKFQKLLHDGMIDAAGLDEQGVGWMVGFLNNLSYVGGHYTTPLLLLTIAAIVVFEWLVKNENKPLMRLSAWGTLAAGLAVVVLLTAGSLVVPFTLAMPAMGQMARPWAVEQIATIDNSLSGVEAAAAAKTWDEARDQATKASNALTRLAAGPALTSLTKGNDRRELDDMRVQLMAARQRFGQAEQAIATKDSGRLETALKEFHEAYGPLQAAARSKR